jgi:hypothetical protein
LSEEIYRKKTERERERERERKRWRGLKKEEEEEEEEEEDPPLYMPGPLYIYRDVPHLPHKISPYFYMGYFSLT